ncbi:MAG TPA: class I SAM-dependent methyltransferase [Casimicrobiaceae bacterium]|nr:class I SAM-dependent methyltransferase [Casimicrobiaceae bacterium]
MTTGDTASDRPMQHYYAARAGEYDRIYQKPERQGDLRKIERWLQAALAGCSVLEIACGTGYWTQFYAPRCRRVLALDSAPETLGIARTRPLPDRVSFIVGDAYRIPAQSERFGAGFAGFWWSHIPLGRIREFLRGLHAALLPDAKVVFLDNRYVEGSSTPISERDSEGNTYQARRLADGSIHRVLKNFPSREELLQAISPVAACVQYLEWQYYWAVEYRLPAT